MKLLEIRIRGGQHHDFDRALDAHALFLGCQLRLKREPDNPYDSNAVAAYVKLDTNGQEEWKIGYVAADKARIFFWRMDQGGVVHNCKVTKIDKHALNATLDLRGGWGRDQQRDEHAAEKRGDVPDDDIPF